jgi:hypothetical protein
MARNKVTPEEMKQYEADIFSNKQHDLNNLTLDALSSGNPSLLIIALVGHRSVGSNSAFLDNVINRCKTLEDINNFITAFEKNCKKSLGADCFSACTACGYSLIKVLKAKKEEVTQIELLSEPQVKHLSKANKFIVDYAKKELMHNDESVALNGVEPSSIRKKLVQAGSAINTRLGSWIAMPRAKVFRNVGIANIKSLQLRSSLQEKYGVGSPVRHAKPVDVKVPRVQAVKRLPVSRVASELKRKESRSPGPRSAWRD